MVVILICVHSHHLCATDLCELPNFLENFNLIEITSDIGLIDSTENNILDVLVANCMAIIEPLKSNPLSFYF